MALFRLSTAQQREFALYPEIFPGAQLGLVIARNFERQCLIVCDQIAVYLDDRLASELETFLSPFGAGRSLPDHLSLTK
jgi:hypothetical protein